jgi:Tfp pilus assembly protein PilX
MNPQNPIIRISGQPKGFALVVVLSLMILLTLLAVGLLSLSSVALRSSAQGSAMAIARSNARLAMLIALGELQKTAGPDQRVTAPADLAGDKDGQRLPAGDAPANTKSFNSIPNGLTTVQLGTRYWTGVWDTVTTSAPASQIYSKTPSATNARWLISGNETGLPPEEAFTPASSVATVSSAGKVSNPEQSALLVGRNSVGPPSPLSVEGYVAAPMVKVEIEGAGTKVRGRYAWWVGDEGVKARFNRAARPGQQKATYEALANTRGGWEVVSGMQNYPVPTSPEHQTLSRVVTLPTGELVNGLTMTGQSNPSLFHAATTDSFGVLADSLQSGLRIDLTSTFSRGFPAPDATTFPNAPQLGSNIVPASAFSRTDKSNLQGPKWDTLKSFYTTSQTVSTENKLTVKAD